nr:hypothetical protein Iba_chr04cCG12260 [Ipomoea batatas]
MHHLHNPARRRRGDLTHHHHHPSNRYPEKKRNVCTTTNRPVSPQKPRYKIYQHKVIVLKRGRRLDS